MESVTTGAQRGARVSTTKHFNNQQRSEPSPRQPSPQVRAVWGTTETKFDNSCIQLVAFNSPIPHPLQLTWTESTFICNDKQLPIFDETLTSAARTRWMFKTISVNQESANYIRCPWLLQQQRQLTMDVVQPISFCHPPTPTTTTTKRDAATAATTSIEEDRRAAVL